MDTIRPTRCPHCDSNIYFAQNFERVRDHAQRIEKEYKLQASRHAVEVAKWNLKEIEREESMKFLQRKNHQQRLTILRLEDKLKKLKAIPYGEEE